MRDAAWDVWRRKGCLGGQHGQQHLHRLSNTKQGVGTHGKLRLRPEGKPTIVIEHDREHANTIIVDIDASHGTVKAEFIPDNSSEFLAEMPETRVLTSFYLAKNGDVFNGPSNCKTSDRRHIQIRQADIYDVIFCDFDGKSQFGLEKAYSLLHAKVRMPKRQPFSQECRKIR